MDDHSSGGAIAAPIYHNQLRSHMNEHSASSLAPEHRFTLHPRVRWKIRLFQCAIGFVAIMVAVIRIFRTKFVNIEMFANISLIPMFLAVLSVILASILIRCPRCGGRPFTVSLMYRSKMPDQWNHRCPHCGFPKDDLDFQSGAA